MDLLNGLEPINIVKGFLVGYLLTLLICILIRLVFIKLLGSKIKSVFIINLLAVLVPTIYATFNALNNSTLEPIIKAQIVLIPLLVFITFMFYDLRKNSVSKK